MHFDGGKQVKCLETPQWVRKASEMRASSWKACDDSSGNVCACDVDTVIKAVRKLCQHRALPLAASIPQHVSSSQWRQALYIYQDMRNGKVEQRVQIYISALKACGSLKDLESAKWIHAHAIDNGFGCNVYLGTMLVDTYAKCGSLADARCTFDRMPFKNVVSWNAMIMGYTYMGEGELALQLFSRLEQESVAPDSRTFVGALKACRSLAGLQEGEQGRPGRVNQCLEHVRFIHSIIVKLGVELDVHLGSMLVDVYSKCGSLEDARLAFETMRRRNVVCWNAIILGYAQTEQAEVALDLYSKMQQEGPAPNARTYVAVLKAYASLAVSLEVDQSSSVQVKEQRLQEVKLIHSDMVKAGLETDVYAGSMLVDTYGKCGSLVNAKAVFEKLPHRNVVSWNAIILGYAQIGEGEEALKLYARMQQEGVIADNRTFVAALKACSSLSPSNQGSHDDVAQWEKSGLAEVRAIHEHLVKRGVEFDAHVGNMLVDAYAECGSLENARYVFQKMSNRNVVSWTTMILAYAQIGEGEVALQLYSEMQQEGLAPNDRTFVGALKACSSLAASAGVNSRDSIVAKKQCLDRVRLIHSEIVTAGFESDEYVGSMLVHAYAKLESLVDSRLVFEKMTQRNVVSWTAMILGYAQLAEGEVALDLYVRMQREGVPPNERTIVGALLACCSVAAVERGKEIHSQLSRTGSEVSNSFVSNALINMYSKCGSMGTAQLLFEALETRDVVAWNVLIAGYARQGESRAVFHLFRRMKQDGIQPEGLTFLCILTVCCHSGLLDCGLRCFETMSRDYGISPTIEHYICIIDLLGRAGQLDRALWVARTMPVTPDNVVWRTLLSACQKWGNVELAREAFEFAIGLDKNDAASYVLMSNIYASVDMLKEAKYIQAMRLNNQAWKKPGKSWLTDKGGLVHSFHVGDEVHSESPRTYAGLQDLAIKMAEEISDIHADFLSHK